VELLLDTHVVLGLLEPEKAKFERWTTEPVFVSVASIWEIGIKVRQGKLMLPATLYELEERLVRLGCQILTVTGAHAVADVDPWPDTNDPFDRLLLAVCEVEGLRLVTRDAKLKDHPLAWRPPPA
jgi:PIN domain nuclease of toxin-antitoxin system